MQKNILGLNRFNVRRFGESTGGYVNRGENMKKSISMLILFVILLLTACGNHPVIEDEVAVTTNDVEPYPILGDISPDGVPMMTQNDTNLDNVFYINDLPEIPPEPQMTAFGRQIAEDFLMQFPSIFIDSRDISWLRPYEAANKRIYFPFPQQIGRETDDGRFIVWDNDLSQTAYSDIRLFHIGYQFGETYAAADGPVAVRRELILTENIPDIFFRTYDSHRHGFYDGNLNRIENADWMLHGQQYATDFVLWDFDQNGIPEIEIQYWGDTGMGVWPTSPNNSLFVFDGYEYRRVAISENEQTRAWRAEYHRDMYEWVFVNNLWANMILDHLAFLDPDGNLIFMPRVFDEESVGYYYVVFEGDTAEFQQIISIPVEEAPNRWYHEAHYMPGTNILLTPLRHLGIQQAEMYETIHQRLLAEYLN